MRVIVCGGRDYEDTRHVFTVLDYTLSGHAEEGDLVLILGGAKGADELARVWAMKRQVPHMVFPARWRTYGNRAGPIRNGEMLRRGRPDLVIAFPGGTGTEDMKRQAREANVYVADHRP